MTLDEIAAHSLDSRKRDDAARCRVWCGDRVRRKHQVGKTYTINFPPWCASTTNTLRKYECKVMPTTMVYRHTGWCAWPQPCSPSIRARLAWVVQIIDLSCLPEQGKSAKQRHPSPGVIEEHQMPNLMKAAKARSCYELSNGVAED